MPTVILLDNGSSRAGSTHSLRRLADAVAKRIGTPVDPVSLLHADKVPAAELDGRTADTFVPFLRRRVQEGERHFLALPLFFGRSGALTGFIPDKAAEIAAELGGCEVEVAEVLCPLPEGEPRLVEILCDHVRETARSRGVDPRQVVLVDHGSPLARVTEVRRTLARGMRTALGEGVRVSEAVMERRPGPEYDFNGPLLEQVLRELGAEGTDGPVIVAMLFLAPGRHAGAGGDIAEICARVRDEHPRLEVIQTPLVGAHPLLVDILADRYRACA